MSNATKSAGGYGAPCHLLSTVIWTTNMKIPAFTEEQVEYLNALWPEKCPEKSHSDREIWIAVGARSVVRHINSLYEAQVERIMKAK